MKKLYTNGYPRNSFLSSFGGIKHHLSFFILFFLSLGLGVSGVIDSMISQSRAEAATVTKLLNKKKVVVIDSGKSAGIEKQTRVCFFNKKGKKVGCGKVRRVSGEQSFVRLKSKAFKKVKKGFTAEVEGGSMGSGGEMSQEAGKPGSSGPSGSSFAVRGLVGGALSPAYSSTAPVYATETAPTGEKYWDEGEASSGSGIFVGSEFEYIPFNIAAGFRYFVSQSGAKLEMDYIIKKDNTKDSPYAFLETTASSLGFWFDYLYPISFGSMSFNVGAGLDIDMSTLTTNVTLLEPTDANASTQLIKQESSLTAIGLRIPVRLDIALSSFKLFVSGVAVIGVSGEAAVSGADTEDANSKDAATYAKDFITAQNHTPGTGLMGALGMSYEF